MPFVAARPIPADRSMQDYVYTGGVSYALRTDPEGENEEDERFAAVSRLIDHHLTPLQRRLLYRRDVDGIDYATLAQEEGMTETALRMQISRARRTVRHLYQQQNSTHV